MSGSPDYKLNQENFIKISIGRRIGEGYLPEINPSLTHDINVIKIK